MSAKREAAGGEPVAQASTSAVSSDAAAASVPDLSMNGEHVHISIASDDELLVGDPLEQAAAELLGGASVFRKGAPTQESSAVPPTATVPAEKEEKAEVTTVA